MKQKIIFVSAIYSIYKNQYASDVWKRLDAIARHIPIHLFCSVADLPKALAVPNITVHLKEFDELETYAVMEPTTGLPGTRKAAKDTKEFMILMNAKTEFIRAIADLFEAEHYVWIDAGISKIFSDPGKTVKELYKKLLNHDLRSSHILIPGCPGWGQTRDLNFLCNSVSWRFCGGFFIVPYSQVRPFYEKVLVGCKEILTARSAATWEVNVWVYMESQLNIQWSAGDHNESIFHCVDHYITADLVFRS